MSEKSPCIRAYKIGTSIYLTMKNIAKKYNVDEATVSRWLQMGVMTNGTMIRRIKMTREEYERKYAKTVG